MIKWILNKTIKTLIDRLGDYKVTGNTTIFISQDKEDMIITIRCSNTKVEKI